MNILHRDSLPLGGFAGVREHQLVKAPQVFGPAANRDHSWPGLGSFVYLADARFTPKGETGMHPHHEVDVISVMVEGRIAHQGSLEHGQELRTGGVQVQRAGGEGFTHNEVNPDDEWNRMIQLWVLPETPGQAADYRYYQPRSGQLSRVYGGNAEQEQTFTSHTQLSVATLEAGQRIEVQGRFLVYFTRGSGKANGQAVSDGDLMRDVDLEFIADNDVQLIVVHAH